MQNGLQKYRSLMTAEFEVKLRDVMMYAHHGVLPEESTLGNQYRINVCLRIDASEYDDSSENLGGTISYAEVFDILQKVMSQPVALLETVAVRFAKKVCDKWQNINSGEIEIIKTVPPIPGMIGEASVCYKF